MSWRSLTKGRVQLGIERFHNDLLAALQTRVPLEIGESSIVRLTKPKLNQFQEVLAGLGDSPDLRSLGATSGGSVELPKRYLAAVRTFTQTGSMSAVLDGLTARTASSRKVNRLLRRIFLYLTIIMAAAVLGLFVFFSGVAPVIEEVRTDIFRHRDSLRGGFDFIAWLPVAIGALLVVLILFLLWIAFGGVTRTAMWLGGRQYVRCWSSAIAVRVLELLIDKGMGIDEAIEVSCDLAGVDEVGRREIQVAIEDSASSIDGPVVANSEGSEPELNSMANYMLVLAEHRLEKMRFSVPVVLLTLVGGIVSLAYCVAIFAPIVSLLLDLKFVGTN